MNKVITGREKSSICHLDGTNWCQQISISWDPKYGALVVKLRYWGIDKIAAIVRTTISHTFSLMEMLICWTTFRRTYLLKALLASARVLERLNTKPKANNLPIITQLDTHAEPRIFGYHSSITSWCAFNETVIGAINDRILFVWPPRPLWLFSDPFSRGYLSAAMARRVYTFKPISHFWLLVSFLIKHIYFPFHETPLILKDHTTPKSLYTRSCYTCLNKNLKSPQWHESMYKKQLSAFYSYDNKSFTFWYTDQAAPTSVMAR